MRRALLIVAGLAFVLSWFAGKHLPSLVAIILNAVVLIHFELATVRRLLFTGAALSLPPPPFKPLPPLPRLTALVPCRNEAAALADTLQAWDEVDYPRSRLQVVFIDDDSADETPKLLEMFAAHRPWVVVLRKDGPAVGKGAALAAGLAAAHSSDGVVVFDADARPAADCLMILTEHLNNPAVAAVAGRMIPDDRPALAAVYARAESAVHQRLTLTGATRLGATVPLLGSAYLVRRNLLDVLGFDPTHRLEDIDLSLRLLERGFRISFEPHAVCRHRPPADWRALTAQRTAWARGFHRIIAEHLRPAVVAADSGLLAIDRLLYTLGYFDRVSLLLGLLLCALDAWALPALWLPWWVIVAYLAVPLAQVPLAALLDGWTLRQLLRLPLALLMSPVEALAEPLAWLLDFVRLPLRWRKIPRAGEERGHG